jgi:hypothetical protein
MQARALPYPDTERGLRRVVARSELAYYIEGVAGGSVALGPQRRGGECDFDLLDFDVPDG